MTEGRYIDVDGVRTHYFDRGRGPTIVLVHGGALSADAHHTWFRTIAGLERDYRVVAPDLINFGRTDLAKDGRFKDRLERVDHLVKFLKALDIRDACLVGHSEGGFMATRAAIIEPTIVSRLVIVTSGATAPNLGGDRDNEWIAANLARYGAKGPVGSEDDYIRRSQPLNFRHDPDYEAVDRENFRRAIARGQEKIMASAPASDGDYREREKMAQTHIYPYLKDVKIPVLLIWALQDKGVIVERGLKLLEYFPHGEFHVFSSASHYVMHDRADDFNRLLRGWCRPDTAGA